MRQQRKPADTSTYFFVPHHRSYCRQSATEAGFCRTDSQGSNPATSKSGSAAHVQVGTLLEVCRHLAGPDGRREYPDRAKPLSSSERPSAGALNSPSPSTCRGHRAQEGQSFVPWDRYGAAPSETEEEIVEQIGPIVPSNKAARPLPGPIALPGDQVIHLVDEKALGIDGELESVVSEPTGDTPRRAAGEPRQSIQSGVERRRRPAVPRLEGVEPGAQALTLRVRVENKVAFFRIGLGHSPTRRC